MDRTALLAQVDAIEAQLRSLRASVEGTDDDDQQLDAKQALERFGVGHDGLLAAERRGEIALTRGPRRKILVRRSALEAYLARPHAPTAPKRRRKVEAPDYDAEVARELRLLAGGRR
jgi:hypothetical protein